MATTDFKERLNKITLRNMKVKHKPNATWPVEKKIEVISQYLVLGNLRMVAASCGVNYDLVRQWKGQPWWKELESEIRQTQNIEMDTKLSKIVERSLDAVLDRVEHGDFIWDQKSQEMKRKPVALRDVHRVSIDTLAKRELLRGNATERKETTQVTVAEQLKILADEFAKWTKKPVVIELNEVEDADYRETGENDPGATGGRVSTYAPVETEESGEVESISEGTLPRSTEHNS